MTQILRLGECGRLRARVALLCFCAAAAFPMRASAMDSAPVRVLDDFHDIAAWHVATSDDVQAKLLSVAGSEGNALCMDFDFGEVSGYAVARRELPLKYAADFEFSFRIRGDAPRNALQFKLVDASGDNVWWVNRPDYVFPHEWRTVRFRKRDIAFAWGPSKDRQLRRSAQLEFVIARGRGGGKGTVCFDRLTFRDLPVDISAPPAPELRATSALASSEPRQALDGNMDTAWRSDPAAGPSQTLIVDFRRPRELGGLVLHWLPDAFASRYAIDFSDDGERWHTVRHVVDGNGGTDPHLLPESETRYVRLRLEDGPGKAYALAEIEVKDLAFGASPNAFFEALAKVAPRGSYPRAFTGEQSYWTIVGIDGGSTTALLSEDGALEVGPACGSVEPFLIADGTLVTWADVETEHSPLDGYLPIPTVTWQRPDLSLRVTAFGTGSPASSQVVSRYTVDNLSDRARVITLALAVRPFQVNPPTQFLNTPGGVAPIHELSWDGQALSIDGKRRLVPLAQPNRVFAADFDAGNLPELLVKSRIAGATTVWDETGFASAALLYRLELPPRGSRAVDLLAPLSGAPSLPERSDEGWPLREQTRVANLWRKKIDVVSLRLPAGAQAIADTLRTALAHILLSRAGPALQPGTRAYARSWIRDGAMMSDALLRLGRADVVRDYADWFAAHQFASGKVPCCVDARGSDPVAENDSPGELVHLIAQYYRYTRDRAWLQKMWPHVASAMSYMESLRAQERTDRNRTEARRALFGLLPASISHEGYSDRPAYAYWDDFWALAGYNAAVEIAGTLGRDEEARKLAVQRDEFRHDLEASLRASIARHQIDYIPGSADRGDFDATATTIALSVAGEQARLPEPELRQTFERYWSGFVQRRDSGSAWDDYTPYELRSVGAFVRLGWRDRALQLLDFFLGDRRPAGWNQWAEVVGRNPRQPRFVGDMPHGWIASDFIQSTLDLFAYERAADRSLVLAAGVAPAWLTSPGIAIANLRTPYGTLSYALKQEAGRLMLTIPGGAPTPPGGLVFLWPYPEAPGHATIDGHPAAWENGNELHIRRRPAATETRISVEIAETN